MVEQQRFIWNPSFVLPSLMVSMFSFVLYEKTQRKSLLILSAFSLAFAVALNFSAFPTWIAFCVTAILIWKKDGIVFFIYSIAAHLFWNLPTVLFEIKRQFLLTKLILERGMMPQERLGLEQKFASLFSYIFSHNVGHVQIFLILFIVAFFLSFFFLLKKQTSSTIFVLFLFTQIFTFIAPFDIQSHYIFPMLTAGILLIAFLPSPWSIAISLLMVLFWSSPVYIRDYLRPARRTVDQLEQCAQQFCAVEKEPIVVSTQAGFHVYHTGPEYRYLFKKHGCHVKTLETEGEFAEKMAVVVDNSGYNHGVTAFHELTLFGPSVPTHQMFCDGNLKIVTLMRKQ
jgi:hypothetical protein